MKFNVGAELYPPKELAMKTSAYLNTKITRNNSDKRGSPVS